MSFSDQTLVTEIRSGSGVAFEQLMRRYERLVYKVAYGLTRDREAAMDVTQETFMKVHGRLTGWRGEGGIKNWIARIAANEAMNWQRSVRRRANVKIVGTGGSSVVVDCRSKCRSECGVEFQEDGDRLTIRTTYRGHSGSRSSIALNIEVPRFFDVELDSMGGRLSIDGVEGTFNGKTMGGDIEIASVDGWVEATTMGGHVDVTVAGAGGHVTLVSMSGDIVLSVPSGFGMDLDLEIAFTRNSRKDYQINALGGLNQTTTPDWDYDHGTPRKYIRMAGSVGGSGNAVKVRTVNGNITVREH